MFLVSCGSQNLTNKKDPEVEFKKICVEGSGKGRIELLATKHTFSYESRMDRPKNKFDLVLDFPIVGERELNISLDPAIVNSTIKNSEITKLLNDQLGERTDKKQIAKSVEEFFVFASDFMRFKAANIYPKHYSSSFIDDHFILERQTASYRFVVDNFSVNEKFYERVVFKIFIKDLSSNAILTLFLVPQSCDM
jgi:hypothetical protein